MAIFSAGAAGALDMGALNLAASLSNRVQFSDEDLISLENGSGRYDDFRGSFIFAHPAAAPPPDEPGVRVSFHGGEGIPGYADGGVINSLQEFSSGLLLFDVTGMSADAVLVFGALKIGAFQTAMGLMFAGADQGTGSALADSLRGYGGADTLSGGGGNDSIDGDAGGDSLSGGAGADLMRGLDDNDTLDGGAGDDDINGNLGADIVRGGDGADIVRGGQGNDTVLGEAGDDVHVNGNLGDDQVFGGTGNDTLFGGQGSDTLSGDAGDDRLSGDLGSDVLIGGAGADRFVAARGSGLDWVADFNAAEGDRVLLAPGTAYTLTTISGQVALSLGGGDMLGLVGVTAVPLGEWVLFG